MKNIIKDLNISFHSQDNNYINSIETSFNQSFEISTKSDSRSFGNSSFYFERESEREFCRQSNIRFKSILNRSLSNHKKYTNSSLNESYDKLQSKKNIRKFFGLPVFEEKEEQEKEKCYKPSKIKILRDDEEFGSFNQKSSRREKKNNFKRGKSVEPLRLAEVKEAIMEEDQRKPNNLLFKLDIIRDKNEFNKDKNFKLVLDFDEKKIDKKFNSYQTMDFFEKPIAEEFEKDKGNNNSYDLFSFFSNVSSNNSSPRFKLKVDELGDRIFERKKKIIEDKENEIIEEEEKIDLEENLSFLMKNLRKQRSDEKCYLRKIIKGEIIEEKDLIFYNLEKKEKESITTIPNLQPLVESEYEILSRSETDESEKETSNILIRSLNFVDMTID